MSKLQVQKFKFLAGLVSLVLLSIGGPIVGPVVSYAQDLEMVTCLGIDGDVKFEVQIDRTRARFPKALAMRVSDPNVSPARQEIAFFDVKNGLLSTDGNQFTGHVSDVHPLTGRRGERIGGTLLGALEQVTLEVDIDFSEEPSARKRHAAVVTYIKKNGEELVQDLDCRRQK